MLHFDGIDVSQGIDVKKKTGLKRNVTFDFNSADFNPIDTNNISCIHEYSMKENSII